MSNTINPEWQYAVEDDTLGHASETLILPNLHIVTENVTLSLRIEKLIFESLKTELSLPYTIIKT